MLTEEHRKWIGIEHGINPSLAFVIRTYVNQYGMQLIKVIRYHHYLADAFKKNSIAKTERERRSPQAGVVVC